MGTGTWESGGCPESLLGACHMQNRVLSEYGSERGKSRQRSEGHLPLTHPLEGSLRLPGLLDALTMFFSHPVMLPGLGSQDTLLEQQGQVHCPLRKCL